MANALGSTLPVVLASPRRRLLAPALKTAFLLTVCLGITAAAFFTLTRKYLTRSNADVAVTQMEELLRTVEARLLTLAPELPIRLLTAPGKTTHLPQGGPLPGSYAEFLGTARERVDSLVDPWGSSYLLVATNAGAKVRVHCISAGPNGVFETTIDDPAATSDDIAMRLEFERPSR